MPTLVLSPRYTPDSNVLWQAALRANWSVLRLQNHRAPDELKQQDVVIYGEALFVAIIADQLDLALLETPLDWLPSLPFAYRQRDVYLTTLKEARSITHPAFIKPAADKTFDAKVYESGAALPSPDWFDDATRVLVSEPVQWEIEFRSSIADCEVRTISPYSRYGELIENEAGEWIATEVENHEADQLLDRILGDEAVAFPPAIVLDIGKISGRGWAVVEANPAWASGIYGNNPDQVLKALAKSCLKRADLPDDYHRWLINRV
jgi:hypothetical protein